MSTLLKAISDSDTTLMFSENMNFPLVHGVILIELEQISYDSNYNGTLYGCTRGVNSTSASAHAAGVSVSLFGFYNAGAGTPGVFTSVTITGLTASTALIANSSKVVTSSSTTDTELSYVHGVTSAIQTQLTAKAPTDAPVFTTSVTTPVTANKALATGTAGILVASTTTATELGYVAGVTSAIQTQLNSKQATLTLPLTVANGGIGVSTLTTAYGTLCAGTTATGTVQTVSPGTSGQVLTSNGASSLPTYQAASSSGSSFGFKNRIINGDFRLDQRNAGTSVALVSNTNTYGPDTYFSFNRGKTALWTMQQSTATPPSGFEYYNRITITTPDASPVHDAEYVLSSRIEGFNLSDFNLGLATAIQFTFSFWVRSSITGTFGGSFENNTATFHAYVFQYTINSANTWEYKTVTLTGDTGGTWTTGATLGMKLILDFGSGSDFAGTASTWNTAGEANHITGNTQLVNTNGATWDITGIQLEAGSSATNFDYRSIQQELLLAQRYYEKSYVLTVKPGTNTGNGSGSSIFSIVGVQLAAAETDYFLRFKTTKYAVPTMTWYTPTGTAGSVTCFATTGASTARVVAGVENQGTDYMGFYQTNAVEPMAQGHYTAEANI